MKRSRHATAAQRATTAYLYITNDTAGPHAHVPKVSGDEQTCLQRSAYCQACTADRSNTIKISVLCNTATTAVVLLWFPYVPVGEVVADVKV